MKRKPNRRDLLLSSAGAAAALALGETDAAAQQQPNAKEALAASTQALVDLVRVRFGKHLTEGQLERIRQSLIGQQLSANALKAIRLENGDEPDFAFSVEEA